jgi:UDP-N-acetylmuramate--alanine ligase
VTREDVILTLAQPAHDSPLRMHLIGVAGSGMSGIASLFLGLGHQVSGSDRVATAETTRLESIGLKFSSPHTAEAVADAQVVVYSSAVKSGNLAYDAAIAAGLILLRRAEALAAIMQSKKGIIVSGTHGKTTTSALLAHVMRVGGVKPSHYVGAEIPLLGVNAHYDPEGEHLVAEGDESDGTLVSFHPDISIVLNIEAEHLDFYSGLDQILDVFGQLIAQTNRFTVYCGEDENATMVCADLGDRAISYGWSRDFDYSAGVVSSDAQSSQFSVFHRGELLGRLELNIPGKHNVLNALSAIAVAHELGVSFKALTEALGTFRGARRRFDRKYTSPNHVIVDDYGHHPTEVAATLETARSQKPNRLVVLFQPHRYSRTQRLATDFGKAFGDADVVFVSEIYPASEAPIPGVTGQTIVDAIQAEAPEVEVAYISDNSQAHWIVGRALQQGDLLLTLGAGDVHLVGKQLAKDLEVLEALEEVMAGEHGPSHLYEPMGKHTTLRVGGPAQYWIEPHSFSALASVVHHARQNQLPVRVIGRGSNLLVKDGGISGVVIHPVKGAFGKIEVRGNEIEAGAGARLKTIAGSARNAGLGDFEWMEGIPGNVGGSLRMNAGAMGTATFDQVVTVKYLDWESGEIREKSGSDFNYHYRNVPELTENIALSAVFKGTPATTEAIDALLEESKSKRKTSQPVGPSAGCIFKNPDTIPAGKLVDELGMKNYRHQHVRVSNVHGNFIVNDGAATANEVLALINEIQTKALKERAVTLEPEVQILGDNLPTPHQFVR